MTQSTKLIKKSNKAMMEAHRAESLVRRLEALRRELNDTFEGEAELARVLAVEMVKLDQTAVEQREVFVVYRSNAAALERDGR